MENELIQKQNIILFYKKCDNEQHMKFIEDNASYYSSSRFSSSFSFLRSKDYISYRSSINTETQSSKYKSALYHFLRAKAARLRLLSLQAVVF